MITSYDSRMIKIPIQIDFQGPDTSVSELNQSISEENNGFLNVAVAGGDLQYGSRWTLNVW